MQDTLLFEYISESIPGLGHDPSDFQATLQGCRCRDGCRTATGCSCLPFGENYSTTGMLRQEQVEKPLMECGCRCACPADCPNRVVQRGINVRLRVRPTDSGKGYGLYTEQRLCRGQFVCCYAGEVISASEAASRLRFLPPGAPNFIFVLREHGPAGHRMTCVDPTRRGNLGRFINHSCQPNLNIIAVRYSTPLARLALFANQDIPAMMELCYSYGSLTGREDKAKLKPCYCNSDNCQQYLPSDLYCFQEDHQQCNVWGNEASR